MLIHNKDDIEFDTEFPCLLGHPVVHDPRKLFKSIIVTLSALPPIFQGCNFPWMVSGAICF